MPVCFCVIYSFTTMSSCNKNYGLQKLNYLLYGTLPRKEKNICPVSQDPFQDFLVLLLWELFINSVVITDNSQKIIFAYRHANEFCQVETPLQLFFALLTTFILIFLICLFFGIPFEMVTPDEFSLIMS